MCQYGVFPIINMYYIITYKLQRDSFRYSLDKNCISVYYVYLHIKGMSSGVSLYHHQDISLISLSQLEFQLLPFTFSTNPSYSANHPPRCAVDASMIPPRRFLAYNNSHDDIGCQEYSDHSSFSHSSRRLTIQALQP